MNNLIQVLIVAVLSNLGLAEEISVDTNNIVSVESLNTPLTSANDLLSPAENPDTEIYLLNL